MWQQVQYTFMLLDYCYNQSMPIKQQKLFLLINAIMAIVFGITLITSSMLTVRIFGIIGVILLILSIILFGINIVRSKKL
jgi:hypothetical protein